MNAMVLQVKIKEVGLPGKEPTRFDIYVEGVPGAVCGNAKNKSQAESWADGVQLALNEQHKISINGLNGN